MYKSSMPEISSVVHCAAALDVSLHSLQLAPHNIGTHNTTNCKTEMNCW